MSKNFIEIKNGQLMFNFAEIGSNENFGVTFQRTLRIPDDNKKYSLPPSLGHFPIEHVEDYAKNLPENWSTHGGVFFPMYQAEAMWMSFSSHSGRPFAIKIASGKVNAVSGKAWDNKLQGNAKTVHSNEVSEGPFPLPGAKIPEANMGDILKSEDRINGRVKIEDKAEPDYMVAPKQPWLDGFNVGKGVIRQFVAVPLDSGYTVEEQVTGVAEHGGIQIIVYPMKEELWQKLQAEMPRSRGLLGGASLESMVFSASAATTKSLRSAKPDMGLGAGGMMTQDIYEDTYGLDAWDQEQGLRVFVHLANSEQYKQITGKNPPTEPPTPNVYQRYNYPWFDYYSDGPVLSGSDTLSKVDSIGSMQTKKNEQVLPDEGHKPAPNQTIIPLGQVPKKTIKGGSW